MRCEHSLFAHPAAEKQARGHMFCFCFLFIYLFSTIPITIILRFLFNSLKIYHMDLHHIFRIVRTMAVDDQTEISFSIPQGTLLWQPNFFGLVHGFRWTQAASDTAGRANVVLCRASIYRERKCAENYNK